MPHRLPRFFRPDVGQIVLLVFLAAVSPLLVLCQTKLGFLIPFGAYWIALYILVVQLTGLLHLFRDHFQSALGSFFKRLQCRLFRARSGLLLGTAVNLLYGGFRLLGGGLYQSFWICAEGIYYVTLGAARGLVAEKEGDGQDAATVAERIRAEWTGYRRAARLLLALAASLLGILLSMLLGKTAPALRGAFLKSSALFTAYRIGASAYQILAFRKMNRPALLAAKALSLSATFLSILSLQAAILPRFLPARAVLRANAVMGGLFVTAVVLIATIMLRKSKRRQT